MGRRSNSTRPSRNSIRVEGKDWPVLDRLSIGKSRYLILEHLGSAGRKRYRAWDPDAGGDGDLRAILDLPRSPASEQHLRVLKTLSRDNENLPAIENYRAQGERTLIALEWVRGPTLEQYLQEVRNREHPRPSPFMAFRLVRGLAHGLSRLHRRWQIIHADLKPANLILTRNSRLVTIDFGSAWMAVNTLGREEGDGRNAAYAPPELQSAGEFADSRADQFSLSVILYELLTLQLPYDQLGGKAGRPGFIKQMAGTLRKPSTLNSKLKTLPKSVWQGIDRITTTGLALDPDGRYPTPEAWLQDLNEVNADLQIRTRLNPINRFLTQVVGWFADRLGRR